MNEPRVSICIVTYNHERYLRECVMSVVAQAQDVHLEILIGDDHSSDQTESIGRELEALFPEVIRFIRHETNLGPGGNYQSLIRLARGEYIAHLDGDDFWLPGKIISQIGILDNNPDYSAVYTNALCINDHHQLLGVFNNTQPSIIDLKYLMDSGNFLNHSSLIYRAILRKEILSWKPDFIDYKIHLYLARMGLIGYSNSCYVAYRVASSTSMLVNNGEHVRYLYWEAIQTNAPNEKTLYLHPSADFLRRVFFHSLRTRSFAQLKHWGQKTKQEQKFQQIKLITLTCWKIISAGLREIWNLGIGNIGGVRLRVFYWR